MKRIFDRTLMPTAICLAAVLLATAAAPLFAQADKKPGDWKLESIPDIWKKGLGSTYAARSGHVWFRCAIDVPAQWRDRDIELFVEAVDDARQVFFNGKKVGAVGEFPPAYRSGLGDSVRLAIDSKLVRFGEPNLLAIRVYYNFGRTNFNVAAPVLFGGDQAIRTIGKWQVRSGDSLAWGEAGELSRVRNVRFAKLESTADVNRTLRKIAGDAGPQTPEATLAKLRTPSDLVVELALTEPHIGQPLSMKFDARGRLWVMEYRQYPTPAGLKMVSRDKYLRTVYDKVPPAPPNHFRGRDRISIHTDTNGDGRFDRHEKFVDGLSLATSFAIGRGGVWVLNPPYLLFYPDRDGDDRPDGDPEVHLQGFGIEDSHSIANNLRWGPDGWLYACQGSTVTGSVTRPGTKDKPVFSMGQLVWRYHPTARRYEIFAEGGGNAFGLEFDAKGRVYSGHNGGDTRGFHYVQGGYFQKGFAKHGELSNPYAFGYFKAMAHPRVPRFTHKFIIYESGGLPRGYEGQLFGVAPLQSHVVSSAVQQDRSSFKTQDTGHPLQSDDPWVRPVDVHAGPDGGVYIADLYEQRIDHASHYQGRIHRESGRIYRIRGPRTARVKPFDLGKMSTEELLKQLEHPNKWFRQTAQRLLADRRDTDAIGPIRRRLADARGQLAVELLWALNACGGLDEATAEPWLKHDDPYVRLWTVRLLCDDRTVNRKTAQRLVELAGGELNVEVRSQLACSARRLPAKQALPIVDRLLRHSEDVDDIHIPLLLWWAIEAHAQSNRDAIIALFRDGQLWEEPIIQRHILQRVMRRFALAGSQADLLACAELLRRAPGTDSAKQLLAGFEAAYKGRALIGLPDEMVAALSERGGGSLALRVQQADPAAIKEALAIIADGKKDVAQRQRLVEVFAAINRNECVPVLLDVVAGKEPEPLRRAALLTLQAYPDSKIGGRVAELHDRLPAAVREVARTLLASRAAWARSYLKAVDEKRIAADSVPEAIVRKMLLHPDAEIAKLVKKQWGTLSGATTMEMRQEIQRIGKVIHAGSGNPYNGKRLFAEHCGKCHVLFGQGGRIGPDLTSYKRDDLDRVLANVVNPSLEIREGFETMVIYTEDGRALSGFVADQDNRVVVLRGVDGSTVVVRRDNIDEMAASPRSIMPERIIKSLSEQQIRDLFAYLRATQPLP